ncbi:MAG: hypothetical protein K8I30_06000, partial [Anaerolineae bacterium]|nr:hypothetical protein [Anaerolineae bacterium]
ADLLRPKVLYREREDRIVRCGYALEFYEIKRDGLHYFQKEGINAGTSAMMRHYPAQDLNVILLSNMMEGVWEPTARIHEMIAAS